eukprot:g13828.t1
MNSISFLTILCVHFVVAAPYQKPRIPTPQQVADLEEIITEWDASGDKSIRPHIVRWGFHDAGTWDARERNGGAHACMNVENSLQWRAPPNRGLQDIPIKQLKQLYDKNKLQPVVSIPDFFHFAAVVIINIASREAGETLKIPFYWGRTECEDQGEKYDSYQGYAARLPPPTLFLDGIVKNMGDKMGFTLREIVALMGGHTLGNMGNHGSYDMALLSGDWTTNEQLFDNEYFKFLLQRGFFPLKTRDNKGIFRTQFGGCFNSSDEEWPKPQQCADKASTCKTSKEDVYASKGSCSFITMLRTDLELVADTDDNLCTMGVGYSKDPALTRECEMRDDVYWIVKEFAQSNSKWLQAFSLAWTKLQGFGSDRLVSHWGEPYRPDDGAYDNYDNYDADPYNSPWTPAGGNDSPRGGSIYGNGYGSSGSSFNSPYSGSSSNPYGSSSNPYGGSGSSNPYPGSSHSNPYGGGGSTNPYGSSSANPGPVSGGFDPYSSSSFNPYGSGYTSNPYGSGYSSRNYYSGSSSNPYSSYLNNPYSGSSGYSSGNYNAWSSYSGGGGSGYNPYPGNYPSYLIRPGMMTEDGVSSSSSPSAASSTSAPDRSSSAAFAAAYWSGPSGR